MDSVQDDMKIGDEINTDTNNNTPSTENKASTKIVNVRSTIISSTLTNRRHIRKCSNQFVDSTKLHVDVDGKFDYSCDVFFQLLIIIQEKFALFHSDDLILVNGSVKCYKIVRSELYTELYKRRGYLYYTDVDKLKFACYQMLFKINNGHVYNYQVKNNLLHFISMCLEYFPTRNITINEQKQKQKQKNSSIVLLNDKIKRKDYLSKAQSDDYLINIKCQIHEFMAKIYERFQLLQESSESNIIENDKNNENENNEKNEKNEKTVKNTTEKNNVTSNKTPEQLSLQKELLERDFKSIRRTRNQNKNEVIKINDNDDSFKQNHQNEMKLSKQEGKTKQRIKKNDTVSEHNETQVNDRKILPTTSAKKKIQHFKQTHNLENMHNFTTGQFHQIIGNESYEYYEALQSFMTCLHSSINKTNPISNKNEVEALIN